MNVYHHYLPSPLCFLRAQGLFLIYTKQLRGKKRTKPISVISVSFRKGFSSIVYIVKLKSLTDQI